MGVKSTVYITRAQAEQRLRDLYAKYNPLDFSRVPDSEMEDILMRLNDLDHDGEGFENYTIVTEIENER